MTTRQGPGTGTPGLDDDNATVPRRRDVELSRWDIWQAHDAWWQDPANVRRVEVACDDDNDTHAEAKRARADLDRVLAVAVTLIRSVNRTTLVANPTVDQIAGRTFQSRDKVKTGLRVLIAAGVVVNLSKARQPQAHARGRAPKRTLIYLLDAIEARTNSPTDMVRQPPQHGADSRTALELLVRENNATTVEDNVARLPTDRARSWASTFAENIERTIAKTQNRSLAGIRSQYGSRPRQVANEMAGRFVARGMPADYQRLVAYCADKVTTGNTNAATWHAIEAEFPEVAL